MAPLTLVDHNKQDVVVEVLADTREVHDWSNADAREKSRLANARDLEDLRGVNRSCSKNNLLLSLDRLAGSVSALGKLYYCWSARRLHAGHVDALPRHQ